MIENPPANAGGGKRQGFNTWVWKIPWGRAWQPTPIFLSGESSWAEEPVRLQSIGSHSHTTERLSSALVLKDRNQRSHILKELPPLRYFYEDGGLTLLENSRTCKEIEPVNPKEIQP